MHMQGKTYIDVSEFYSLVREALVSKLDLKGVPDDAEMFIEIDRRTVNVPVTFEWKIK